MAKKLVVAGSCVAVAGGCVGIGAIIKTSLAASNSVEDATEANKDDENERTELISEVMSPNLNATDLSSQQTAQEMQTEEKPEVTDGEFIEEDSDEVDVSNSHTSDHQNQESKLDDSDDNLSENKDEAGDNSGLSEKNSTVTYTITGNYPKLKDSCEGCSVNDFKGLLYFLDMENSSWDDNMTDLSTAQNYKNNQDTNIDKSFSAPDNLYDSRTWEDLISEYNDWLQKWEQKMQSSNDEQEQWKTMRDRNLDTFQKKERFNSLFKELT